MVSASKPARATATPSARQQSALIAARRHGACSELASPVAAGRAAQAMLQAAPCVRARIHHADAREPDRRAMAPSTSSAAQIDGACVIRLRCREAHQAGRNIAARWQASMACGFTPSLRHRLGIQGRPAIMGSIASAESCSGQRCGARHAAMVHAGSEQSALSARRWLTPPVRAGAEAASTTAATIASIAMCVATERRSPMSPRQAHASKAPIAAEPAG